MHKTPGNNNGFFLSRNFTLLELIIVISVIILFATMIVASITIPAFATLDNSAKRVRGIFADAQRQSALQGTEVKVEYSPETQQLNLLSGGNASGGISGSISSGPGFDDQPGNSQSSFRIPKKIQVAIPDDQMEVIQYRFFPDGSASGPELTLSFKGRKIVVGISRLTGMSYSREEEE